MALSDKYNIRAGRRRAFFRKKRAKSWKRRTENRPFFSFCRRKNALLTLKSAFLRKKQKK
jgi:hypothetical protein